MTGTRKPPARWPRVRLPRCRVVIFLILGTWLLPVLKGRFYHFSELVNIPSLDQLRNSYRFHYPSFTACRSRLIIKSLIVICFELASALACHQSSMSMFRIDTVFVFAMIPPFRVGGYLINSIFRLSNHAV